MSHSTWEVMRYAIEQRNFLALAGLFLQQKWLRTGCAQTMRFSGYVILPVGLSLIIFVTVVLVRDAVPAFATRGTAFYRFLMFLVVTVSYNILHNYVCAAVFGLNLGRGPMRTGRVQQGKPWARGREARYDAGSESTPSSSSESGGDESSDVFILPGNFNPASGTVNNEVAVAMGHPPFTRTHTTAVARRSIQNTSGPGDLTPPLQQQNSRSRFRRGGIVPHVADWYSEAKLVVAQLVRPLHRCVSEIASELSATAAQSESVRPDVFEEIEAITVELEGYTATQRRYKLLDTARRFCRHCKRLKAPREHHCSVCERCVTRMHHHCPFIAACVDVENVRYFTLLVFWLCFGTFCVNVFIGYGYCRQRAYERAFLRARTIAEQLRLSAPYGEDGFKLTNDPVILSLVLTMVMFVAMCVFVYATALEVLENSTPVERAVITDKQDRVFRSTSFAYRSPYDMGRWRNVLECYRTLDDPLVHADLTMYGGGLESVTEGPQETQNDAIARCLASLLPPPCWPNEPRCRQIAWRCLILWWLMAVPTLRPTGNDGIHYPIFDSETRDLDGYCVAGCRAKERGTRRVVPDVAVMGDAGQHGAEMSEREGRQLEVQAEESTPTEAVTMGAEPRDPMDSATKL